jgi:predicted nucleic acid-binding protein
MASRRPTKTIRVSLDSTVLMAASISAAGAGRELVLRGLRGEVKLFISPLVIIESERNLQNKAPRALPVFDVFKQVLIASSVNPTRRTVVQVAKVVALKDAPIVAAAKRARATYLATYDRRHLLSQRQVIDTHFGITVVFPDEVLKAQENAVQ